MINPTSRLAKTYDTTIYNTYQQQIQEFAHLKFKCPKCKGHYPHYYKAKYLEFGQEICYECGIQGWALDKELHMLNAGEWDIIDEVVLLLLGGTLVMHLTEPQRKAYKLIRANRSLIPDWLAKFRGERRCLTIRQNP